MKIFACYNCDREKPCVLIVPDPEAPYQLRHTDDFPACPFARTVKRWRVLEMGADGLINAVKAVFEEADANERSPC